jgi:CubicO group peptidase (beta-lactamase class C family)
MVIHPGIVFLTASLTVIPLRSSGELRNNVSRQGSGDTVSAVIDATVRRVMSQRDIPGAAVAFVRGDTVLHIRGYGVAERRRGTPVTTETVFQIASLTKPFAATAVLLLADEGRLTLDVPAARYLDWLPDRYGAVTVRQLLTHTSGVAPDMRRANVDEMSEAEFQRRFLEQPASFAPGVRFQYANAGYTLLSQIVERVSGQTFGAYLQRRIFGPLRMQQLFARSPTRVQRMGQQRNRDDRPGFGAMGTGAESTRAAQSFELSRDVHARAVVSRHGAELPISRCSRCLRTGLVPDDGPR